MSMPSPSVIFHQGLRCSKVPRRSAALVSPSTDLSASTSFPVTPTPFNNLLLNTDPTPNVETSLRYDFAASSILQVPASETTTTAPTPIPTHLPLVTSFTVSDTVGDSSFPFTEGRPEAYSLLSSYSSEYPTLEPVASSLSSHLSNSRSSETSSTRTSFTSVPSTTVTSTATGEITHENDPNQNISPSSANDDTHTSRQTLLGSILGAMAFIAAVVLICLLFFRRKRRKSGRDQGFGRNEKLFGTGRQSADSSTGLQHGYYPAGYMRFHYNPAPRTIAHYRDHSDGASAHFSDPFSDSAELHGGSRSSIPRVEDAPQTFFVDSKDDEKPCKSRANLPQRTVSDSFLPTVHVAGQTPDQQSIHSSDRSLGSTLILPGRSSLGSSLQRFSYRVSVVELEPSGANETITKISPRSTRSDPFDLEVPAKVVMHPLGSVTQLRSQI